MSEAVSWANGRYPPVSYEPLYWRGTYPVFNSRWSESPESVKLQKKPTFMQRLAKGPSLTSLPGLLKRHTTSRPASPIEEGDESRESASKEDELEWQEGVIIINRDAVAQASRTPRAKQLPPLLFPSPPSIPLPPTPPSRLVKFDETAPLRTKASLKFRERRRTPAPPPPSPRDSGDTLSSHESVLAWRGEDSDKLEDKISSHVSDERERIKDLAERSFSSTEAEKSFDSATSLESVGDRQGRMLTSGRLDERTYGSALGEDWDLVRSAS